jgi:hypothetical protein
LSVFPCERSELGAASDLSCEQKKAQCRGGSHAQEAQTLKEREGICFLPLNPASRRSELEVDSRPDPRGARTACRIEHESPGRGERVSPLSIASLLAELPDGIVRLCWGREGPNNRPVVPLVNDVDAAFSHRPASSSDKLARAQGLNSLIDHPSRDYSQFNEAHGSAARSLRSVRSREPRGGSSFHSWSILVQRFGKPLKISVVVCALQTVAVQCSGRNCSAGWLQPRPFDDG